MKKNKMMRLASVLLVAVILSTCAISGTFAKYTASDSGNDSARVAKWGVNVVVTGADGFGAYYIDKVVEAGAADITVASADSKDVVAPGTEGTLASYSITGTPEVKTTTSISATLTLTGWEVDSSYYCPIVITVDSKSYSGLDYESADDFKTAVEAAITSTATNEANTNLSSSNTVTWKWAYEGATGTKANQDNSKDSKLGDAATAEIAFALAVSVAQVN